MTDTLAIKLNHEQLYAIEPAVQHIETTGPFVIAIENEGAGRHVHLQLSGGLAAAVSLDEGMHFIDGDSIWTTPVDVLFSRRPIEGTLTLSMGYGQEAVDVTVRIIEPKSSSVESEPSPQEQTTSQKLTLIGHFRNRTRTVLLTRAGLVAGGVFLLLLVLGFWLLEARLVASVTLLTGFIIIVYFIRKPAEDSYFR